MIAGLAEDVVAVFLLGEVMFNSVKNERCEERFKFNSHLQEVFHLPGALLSIKPGTRTIVVRIFYLQLQQALVTGRLHRIDRIADARQVLENLTNRYSLPQRKNACKPD